MQQFRPVVFPPILTFFHSSQELLDNYPSRSGFITGQLSPPLIAAANLGRFSDGVKTSSPGVKTYLPLPPRRPLPSRCEEKQCKTFLVIHRQKVITSLTNGKPSVELEENNRIMTSLQ